MSSADSVEDNISCHENDIQSPRSTGLPDSSHKIQNNNISVDVENAKEVNRSTLFKQGQALEAEGRSDEALKVYLQSLTGIQEHTSYPELPQCLHQVSQIYFSKDEYEKAVHFIQAEKLYYETALIDAAKLHQQFKNAQDSSEKLQHSDAVKAEEFEKLARLCKQEGNPYLALDYCGKAAKIYKAIYGEDHSTTKQALDLFTIIYADVGKKQYAEAMHRSQTEENSTEAAETVHKILPRLGGDANPGPQKATLKKRSSFDSKDKSDERKKKGLRKVRFEEEYEPTPEKDDKDDPVMTTLMMILFVLCTIFFALIGSYVYCHSRTATSPMCASLKSDLSYYFMQVQYTYKHFFQ